MRPIRVLAILLLLALGSIGEMARGPLARTAEGVLPGPPGARALMAQQIPRRGRVQQRGRGGGRRGQQMTLDPNAPYDARFHFVRIRYTADPNRTTGRPSYGWDDPMWIHDYPRAERNLLKILQETTLLAPGDDDYDVLTTDDPELMRYPVAYMCEVGAWNPSPAEATGLHDYLLKGGFLIVDDFRGERDLQYFVHTFRRVIPGAQFMQLGKGHEIFDSFFEIDPDSVIPPYGPRDPRYYGVFEDNDPSKRLMMIVNYDNDIGEYWEWSGTGFYPIDITNEGYKVAIDYIIYALTH
ncbi:MAG: DUF4159 domain-containing protein [Gemmatimonadetes bacterium]|nr:DUF4159 domain-containing protein [Gemmatimonadota bacterium]